MRVACNFLFCTAGLLFLAVLSACTVPPSQGPSVKKEDYTRLNYLLDLNDLSERAFVYHQFCLKDKEPMNANFMANFQIISDMVLDEAVDEKDIKPEFVVKRILDRRRNIHQQLSEHYHSKGCQSEEGMVAANYYRELSNTIPERNMSRY